MPDGSVDEVQASNSKDTILVVEDDEAIRELIVMALSEELDCEICAVSHAYEALLQVQSITPILLLIDYQLPSMTGLQLYDQLHSVQRLAHIPTLIMSANLPWEELEKRHIAGIQKPFELNELFHGVKEALVQSPPDEK